MTGTNENRRSVAVIGASKNRSKFGNKSVRAHVQAGWKVYPVNLREREIEGLETFPSLAQIPLDVDRISVYLEPRSTARILAEIARVGASEVWFNPGSADRQILAEAERLGIPAKEGCSIVDLGLSPSQFP